MLDRMILERLAYGILFGSHLSGKLIISQRGTAVINRGNAEPFQRFGVSDQAEVVEEDLAYEQMSIKELVDLFTGEPVRTSKK